jgi:hypothetical protein
MIYFECEHMVVVAGPHGQTHNILFNPTELTVKSIFEWQNSKTSHMITVDDRAGRHKQTTRSAYVVNTVHDHGTIIVTTHPEG